MADVLLVTALQPGHPVPFVVLAEADDAALRHERPMGMSGGPYWTAHGASGMMAPVKADPAYAPPPLLHGAR